MSDALAIPGRCNGPPESGNGGYTCGLVAARIGGPAEVSLRAPPPLERPLRVEPDADGVRVLDGETLIAEGRPAEPGLEPPPAAPSVAEAERASERGREQWTEGHPFPTCVTCGPDREPGDGLRIFPGPLRGGELFAAPWAPDASVAGPEGRVDEPWIWAALDCPSSAPVTAGGRLAPCVLARLTARIDGPLEVGEPHVIVSWLLERDGRKHESASAILSADGELRAVARALWIELRSG